MRSSGFRQVSLKKKTTLSQPIIENPINNNIHMRSHESYSIPHKNIISNPCINIYRHSRFEQCGPCQIQNPQPLQNRNLKNSISKNNTKSITKYIPYQKTIIDYETRTIKQLVPKTKKIIDFQQRKVIVNVPREVVRKDFIAVEKITHYHKKIIPERTIEMVPVQKTVKHIKYVPVAKQIVHLPPQQTLQTLKIKNTKFMQSQDININIIGQNNQSLPWDRFQDYQNIKINADHEDFASGNYQQDSLEDNYQFSLQNNFAKKSIVSESKDILKINPEQYSENKLSVNKQLY